MIKLIDILNEIEFDKLGEPFNSGDEQQVWLNPEDKNLVIKKYKYDDDLDSIDRIIDLSKKYPNIIAKSFKSDNPKYYFQEKIDTTSSLKDLDRVILTVYNKVIEDLMEKYPTPRDTYKDGENIFGSHLGYLIDENTDDGYKKGNWKSLISKTMYKLSGMINVPMDLLFDPYIYENYSKYLDIIKKLTPIYKFGIENTRVGEFHEGNFGYDKNKNFKIIDI
jgi:hypothetical protein